ncbi:hypothetical protein KKA15_03070 [Patescibacteria group bacterium]|nr:hypothetical protein [Patescibacteria group bacterium]
MKKLTIFATTVAVFTLTVMPVLALDLGTGYLSATGLGTKELRESVMSIVNVALGFLGILAILIILWGGFRWLTAGGSEDKVGEAKKIIVAGIIGLVIILSALAITTFVVSNILTATGA